MGNPISSITAEMINDLTIFEKTNKSLKICKQDTKTPKETPKNVWCNLVYWRYGGRTCAHWHN
jgi:hypothetical protein